MTPAANVAYPDLCISLLEITLYGSTQCMTEIGNFSVSALGDINSLSYGAGLISDKTYTNLTVLSVDTDQIYGSAMAGKATAFKELANSDRSHYSAGMHATLTAWAQAQNQGSALVDQALLKVREEPRAVYASAWVPRRWLPGDKAIVFVSTPMLSLPPDQVHAVLLHEFAHLHHKHGVGLLAAFFKYCGIFLTTALCILAVIYNIAALVLVLSWLLWAFVAHRDAKTARAQEHVADAFVAHIGHAEGLIAFLNRSAAREKDKLTLWSTHPLPSQRIKLLQAEF